MELNDIRIMLAVAREGSLSAASEKLGLTQPTLSKAIARLERENKIKLFERLSRGMRPTELGNAFLIHAQRLDVEAADLYATLRDLRQARAGVLRCGIGQGVPDRAVIALARAMTGQGVNLDLTGGMTDSLQRGVTVGELEFAILGLPGATASALKCLPLCPDPMLPLAPADHRLVRRRKPVPWSELTQAPWIVPGSGTYSFVEFEQNFRHRGFEPPVPAVASHTSQREAALALAIGAVVLMPRTLALEPHTRSQFKPIEPEDGWKSSRKLVVVHREGGYLSSAARKAIDVIKAEMSSSP